MNNNLIEEAKSYIKKIFENDYSGHDYYHTIRVSELATTIARKENADVQIVQLAALLHDVDDRKLSPATYEKKDNARSFLEEHNLTNSQISLYM